MTDTMDETKMATNSPYQACDAVSEEIMRQNEYALITYDAAVDFDESGALAERVERLIEGLKKGFRKAGVEILSANFAVLPFKSADGINKQGILVTTNENQTTMATKYEQRLFPTDIVDVRDFLKACLQDVHEKEAANIKDDKISYLQMPYFVKKKTDQDWSKLDSLDVFDVNDWVFGDLSYYDESSEQTTWPELIDTSDRVYGGFAQRMVFTFATSGGDSARKLAENEIFKSRIRHLVGAFLSTIGSSVDELAIKHARHQAAYSVLRSHEISNKLRSAGTLQKAIEKVLRSQGSSPIELQGAVEELAQYRETLPEIEKLWNTFVGGNIFDRESVPFITAISKWLKANYNRESRSENKDTWRINTFKSKNSATQHSFVVRIAGEVLDENPRVKFYVPYITRILSNLVDNSLCAWQNAPKAVGGGNMPALELDIFFDEKKYYLELEFRDNGPGIDRKHIPMLFRQRIVNDDNRSDEYVNSFGGHGIGLWALGMALTSFGHPYPEVGNIYGEDQSIVGAKIRFRFVISHQ